MRMIMEEVVVVVTMVVVISLRETIGGRLECSHGPIG